MANSVAGYRGEVQAVPLDRAALCLDCETAFLLNPQGCPTCGSRSWAMLTVWLHAHAPRNAAAVLEAARALSPEERLQIANTLLQQSSLT